MQTLLFLVVVALLPNNPIDLDANAAMLEPQCTSLPGATFEYGKSTLELGKANVPVAVFRCWGPGKPNA